MPDDPSSDRHTGGEAYEVIYFAQKHGITKAQAEEIIQRVGNDRDKIDAEAEKLKRS